MFEQASRKKIRFSTNKGDITTEDLWDLPLTSTTGRANLDDIAKSLHQQLQSADNVSFVTKAPVSVNAETKLKFDIVLHVIETRRTENSEALAAKDKSEKKQRIAAIIQRRKEEALDTASLDELEKMLADM